MRCLILAAAANQNPDPNIAQAAKLASIYWMGRVNGATPNANLTAQLSTQTHAMTGPDLQGEARRCGEEMQRRGSEMQAAGQALQAEARARAAQPAK